MHTAIVAKMNDLSSFALHNPAHNIDGSIMSVEQRSGGYDSYSMIFFLRHKFLDGLLHKLKPLILTLVKLQLKKKNIVKRFFKERLGQYFPFMAFYRHKGYTSNKITRIFILQTLACIF